MFWQYLDIYREITAAFDPADLTPMEFTSASVLIENTTTGQTYYSKGASTTYDEDSIASIAKVLTAKVVVDHIWPSRKDELVTIISDDVNLSLDSGNMPLQSGDTISFEDLVIGCLSFSANDCASALARVIGDEIYADAGNTGTQGITRFMEEVQSYADGIVAGTTWGSPDGVNHGSNSASAQQLFEIIKEIFTTDAVVNENSAIPRPTITMGGSNARTFTEWNASPHARGFLTIIEKGIPDVGLQAVKLGGTVLPPEEDRSNALYWQAPGGDAFFIISIDSDTGLGRWWDTTSFYIQALLDNPALRADNVEDEWLEEVVFLMDGNTDTGPFGFTITQIGSPTATDRGFELGSGDALSIPHNENFVFDNDDDFCVDFIVRGDGTAPTADAVFVAKDGSSTGDSEWWIWYDYDASGSNRIRFSIREADNDAVNVASFDLGITSSSPDLAYFFNGDARHVACIKHGSRYAVYVNGVANAEPGVNHNPVKTNGTGEVWIGSFNGGASKGGSPFEGTIEQLRITKGSARFSPERETILGGPLPTTKRERELRRFGTSLGDVDDGTNFDCKGNFYTISGQDIELQEVVVYSELPVNQQLRLMVHEINSSGVVQAEIFNKHCGTTLRDKRTILRPYEKVILEDGKRYHIGIHEDGLEVSLHGRADRAEYEDPRGVMVLDGLSRFDTTNEGPAVGDNITFTPGTATFAWCMEIGYTVPLGTPASPPANPGAYFDDIAILPGSTFNSGSGTTSVTVDLDFSVAGDYILIFAGGSGFLDLGGVLLTDADGFDYDLLYMDKNTQYESVSVYRLKDVTVGTHTMSLHSADLTNGIYRGAVAIYEARGVDTDHMTVKSLKEDEGVLSKYVRPDSSVIALCLGDDDVASSSFTSSELTNSDYALTELPDNNGFYASFRSETGLSQGTVSVDHDSNGSRLSRAVSYIFEFPLPL